MTALLLMNAELKIRTEEALRERLRLGTERGLHTDTDFKTEAEKTARTAKVKAKRSWRQKMGLD